MNEKQLTERPDYEFNIIGLLVIKVPENLAGIIQSVKIGDRVFMEVLSQARAPVSSNAEEHKRGSIVTQKCAHCKDDFEYKFSTRPRTFCDHCKVSRNSKSIRESAARKKKSDKAASDRPPNGRTIASECSQCGEEFKYIYQGRRVRTKCDDCKGGAPLKSKRPRAKVTGRRKQGERPTFKASGVRPPNIDERQDRTAAKHAQGKPLDIPLSRRFGAQGD